MKRIHLFEFEDFQWFPSWLRDCMTKLINVMHGLIDTDKEFAALLSEKFNHYESLKVVDLCSGSGGPMLNAFHILKNENKFKDMSLTLTDLYPNLGFAKTINGQQNEISYQEEPLNATNLSQSGKGIKTMVSSFHHMDKETAHTILKSAKDNKQAICIFEISDNSFPIFLWWIAFPVNIITCLFVTPLARPFTLQQFIFTYLIPILPICFAWDGAVSNARTYTLEDLDILLEGLHSDDYKWEKGIVKGKTKKVYLVGMPVTN